MCCVVFRSESWLSWRMMGLRKTPLGHLNEDYSSGRHGNYVLLKV